jgi:single-stranded DNA-binding protein
MDEKIILSNVRIAGAPTFFPGTDPSKHRCLVTVIKNRGNNKAGQPMRDEFTLVFWGKYAQTCALYLSTGRAINVEVVPRTYTIDSGQVRPDGRKILHRITNFHVRSFEFGADSMKELSARINANIVAAKAEGLIDPNATVTAERLLKVVRPQSYDYNPQLAEQSGMYGNARVFVKGRGFIGSGTSTGAGAQMDEVAALKARLAALEASGAGQNGVTPFPAS